MRTKPLMWTGVSYGAGAIAMLATRRLLRTVWLRVRDEAPPDGTDAVGAPMVDAVSWALATGAGVGVARLLAIKSAAQVWEAAVHEPPPGVDA